MTEKDIAVYLFMVSIFAFGFVAGFFYGKMRLLKDQQKEFEGLLNTRLMISIPMEKGEVVKRIDILNKLIKGIELESQTENQPKNWLRNWIKIIQSIVDNANNRRIITYIE